jgi:2-methylaconitate cis-trans-isomerase PrpF
MTAIELEQAAVPCVIMRGGTSRAVFFRSDALPADRAAVDEIIMNAIGSGDPREIDGLGGADQLTSKVAIIGPPSVAGADVDYTFVQVGIGVRVADYGGNCGNISSAAGVFAIEEGYVPAIGPVTDVRVHNTNTGKVLRVLVPVQSGRVQSYGDFSIPGVPGTGAELLLDFSATTGSTTGKLLPTGSVRDELYVPELERSIEVSVVDVAKPAVFFAMADIGLSASTSPPDVPSEVLERFVAIQRATARMIGLDPGRGLPRPAAVGPPQSYPDFVSGEMIAAESMSFAARWVGNLAPPVRVRKAYAGTGGICTGVAARLAGSVVHEVARNSDGDVVRIGHPSGVFPCRISVADGEVQVAAISRTARRIAEGQVWVPTGESKS